MTVPTSGAGVGSASATDSSSRTERQAERRAALITAMPAVFVLIWSTGFIVARYGMPHAGPMWFLADRKSVV